jgi:hypothetical protein
MKVFRLSVVTQRASLTERRRMDRQGRAFR